MILVGNRGYARGALGTLACVGLKGQYHIRLEGNHEHHTAGIALAAAGALLLNLNFHIANGATNPWQIGASAFDEAVDINMVLTLISATILIVMGVILVSLRRARLKFPAA